MTRKNKTHEWTCPECKQVVRKYSENKLRKIKRRHKRQHEKEELMR